MMKKHSNTIAPYSGPSVQEQREYRAQDDLRVLRQADEIRADKSRVLMAQKIATQEVAALSKIAKGPSQAPAGKKR